MKLIKRTILPVLLATIWISISEFARNEVLLKPLWIKHYQDLGIKFPSEPINGALWGVWSFLLAIAIFILAKRFTLIQTTFFSWFFAFIMMWVAIGNLGVLPFGLLWYAIPLSILESFIAAWIIKKFQNEL
jgi:ABC-type bacteriocin/lantibiotic exporter with double-glycine peptidase domain